MNMKRIQISFLLCLALSFAFSLFAQDTKELILLQTSDVHSRIEPINQKGDRNYDEGGFVRRAAFLDQFRKEHKNVLLFDCGDISQGTPYYNMFQGEVEVKLMNEMGYEAMTIGNHEFDFRSKGLENMLYTAAGSGEELPSLLVCNVDWTAAGEEQEEIRTAFERNRLAELVVPVDVMFSEAAKAYVEDEWETSARNGNLLPREAVRECTMGEDGERVRLYNSDGHFIALYRWKEEVREYHLEKMFFPEK